MREGGPQWRDQYNGRLGRVQLHEDVIGSNLISGRRSHCGCQWEEKRRSIGLERAGREGTGEGWGGGGGFPKKAEKSFGSGAIVPVAKALKYDFCHPVSRSLPRRR